MSTVVSVRASALNAVCIDLYVGWFRFVAKLDSVTVLIAASVATLCICNICYTAVGSARRSVRRGICCGVLPPALVTYRGEGDSSPHLFVFIAACALVCETGGHVASVVTLVRYQSCVLWLRFPTPSCPSLACCIFAVSLARYLRSRCPLSQRSHCRPSTSN